MKKDLHPQYHTIKVVMTDGTEYETRSNQKAEKQKAAKGDLMKNLIFDGGITCCPNHRNAC